MTTASDDAARPARTGGGVLGARPSPGQTFHDRDPQTLAASAICQISPTRCQARTRLYRDGRLDLKAGFVASVATIVLAGLVLYLIFKRKDWL